jgi:hypothetical protein
VEAHFRVVGALLQRVAEDAGRAVVLLVLVEEAAELLAHGVVVDADLERIVEGAHRLDVPVGGRVAPRQDGQVLPG